MVEIGPRQLEVEKDRRSIKIKIKKGCNNTSRGELVWGDCPSGPSGQKIVAEERQGWFGLR